ncbi:MAG TPA: aldo/keto reductase [Stellaceae bacterium]|nr:aldo/keto reductase [Stellaceae bacterium]
MKYVAVKGTQVPALGLGTWQLTGRACYDAVTAALELGYRHIDTADLYGNEAEIGKAVRDSGVDRDAVFITTKVPPSKLAPEAAKRSAEDSLRRLGMDHVDLLLVHWPNPAAPLGATLAAFAELREAGKARHIGVSNFSVKLLTESVETHGADLLANQVEYHPGLAQRPVLEATRRFGMMLTAYAPLARGGVLRDAKIAAIARKYGKTPAQVTLRWLIEQDGVSAVPKATSRAHLAANIAIFDFALTPEDRAAIAALGGDDRIVDWPGYAPTWDPT